LIIPISLKKTSHINQKTTWADPRLVFKLPKYLKKPPGSQQSKMKKIEPKGAVPPPLPKQPQSSDPAKRRRRKAG